MSDELLPPRRGASRNVDDEAGAPQRGDALVTSLRSGGTAASVPGGVAVPTPILYVPGRTPIGGGEFVLNGGDPSAVVAQYTSPDDKPRKVTVVTWGPFPSGNFLGFFHNIAIKITQGGIRGSTFSWHGLPSQVPCEGTRITVEARIANAPYNFGMKGLPPILGSQGVNGPSPYSSSFPTQGRVSSIIVDGHLEEPFGENVTNNQFATTVTQNYITGPDGTLQPDGKSGAQAVGPVLVTACTVTNTSASAILLGIFDAVPNGVGYPQIGPSGFIALPAGSTAGLARELLGSFYSGFSIFGVTAASVLAGGPYVEDANDANVLLSVRGTYFNTGHA